MSFLNRLNKKKAAREVPAWKQALEEADDDSRSHKRLKGECSAVASEAEQPAPKLAATAAATSGANSSSTAATCDLPAEDDDDDDFDEANYRLGDDDEDGADGAEVPAESAREYTAEELLLMREARDAGYQRKTKTFFIEDSLASLEKTAGNERSAQRKEVRNMMRGMKEPMAKMGPH